MLELYCDVLELLDQASGVVKPLVLAARRLERLWQQCQWQPDVQVPSPCCCHDGCRSRVVGGQQSQSSDVDLSDVSMESRDET